MKLHTVCATCFLPDLVADLAGKNPYEKVIIFCEDKFSLSLELALAKKYGGTFNTNVFTFNRYMKKLLPEDKKCLSQEACALVVKRILLENQDKLKCFKRVNDPNLASAVYELIAQLKSAKVTPSDIIRACEQSTGNLKRKLFDVGFLFEKYEQFILQNGLTDGNNRLHSLPEFLKGDSELKQSRVIIAGFPSLNKTLCEIFKSISKNAKQTCFAVVAGDNKKVYTNETYNFALREFNCEEIRHESDEFYQSLYTALYNPSAERGAFQTDKVFFFTAKNAESEITEIAKSIRRAVIDGARYRNFALCAENIQSYELIIKRVFGDYELPYFIDNNKNLGKHPLTRLVCDYLEVVKRGFDSDCVMRLVKNPLFTPDRELAEAFERYYIKFAINRRSVKQPFFYEDERLEEIEELRKRLIYVTGMIAKTGRFNDCVNAINDMLKALCVEQRLNSLSDALKSFEISELGSYNDRAKEHFDKVLSEAVALLGEQKLSLLEIKNLILTGMTACKIPLIPEYNDCVFVGDFRSIKYGRYKNLFAVGLTDSVPSSKLDTALLCDRDILVMEQSQVLVEPKIREVNRRSRENACMALASFTDKLILCYPQSKEDGKKAEVSEIVTYLKNAFQQTGVAVGERATLSGGYLSKRSAIASFIRDTNDFKEGKIVDYDNATAYYKLMKERGQQSLLDEFLSSVSNEVGYLKKGVRYLDKSMSATAIEGYFNCPYANFLSRGLRLQERIENHIMANDLGTMVHDVAERFIQRVDYSKDVDFAKQLAGVCFNEVVAKDEYSRYTKSAGGKRSFELIKRECVRFCADMFMGAKCSSFKPIEIEASFGYKGHPPIKIQTKHGQMQVTGKVDRLDCYDGKMRIIDYKTGMVDAGEVEEMLYTGKKLQLFLYAKAFEDKYQPVGVYYFPIADDFCEAGENGTMALKGRTLADESVVRELDHTITAENTKGSYIDVNVKKYSTGRFASSKKLLTQIELSEYLNYAKAVAGKGLEEMAEGVIVASPYEKSCDYCKYHGICGYNEATDMRTRKAREVNKDTILSALYVQTKLDLGENLNGENLNSETAIAQQKNQNGGEK